MIPTSSGNTGTSTRPYLIRALHDWCTDNGLTPYVAVFVDASVQVPAEYVKNNEIVLNVAFEATTGMTLGNEFIEFKARFGGTSRDIVVPVDHVIAIYARENGQGMAFPAPTEVSSASPADDTDDAGVGSASSAERPAASSGLRLASADGQTSPAPLQAEVGESSAAHDEHTPDLPEPPPSGGGRPSLKRVK